MLVFTAQTPEEMRQEIMVLLWRSSVHEKSMAVFNTGCDRKARLARSRALSDAIKAIREARIEAPVEAIIELNKVRLDEEGRLI